MTPPNPRPTDTHIHAPRDAAASPGDLRTGLSADVLVRAWVDNLRFVQGKLPDNATRNDWYMALAYTIRDRLLDRWIRTRQILRTRGVKVVGYLSAEFLPGPQLVASLIHLGILSEVRTAAANLGQELGSILEHEVEPGLGNGGLGRLAACFLDSLSSLEIPAIGYGIRYEFGIFAQQIVDGWQVETPDNWLRSGNPWEIPRAEITAPVGFGGRTEPYVDAHGRYRVRWIPGRIVLGVAHDTPVPGFRVTTANFMRLWKAEASESFDFRAFNLGDYVGAVQAKVLSENISKVLYPNDNSLQGKQLRLEQQYFFVACSLHDMVRLVLASGHGVEAFAEKFAVQLNDTHPAIAVAELMRLLVDEHGLEWGDAWEITRASLAYTNHTLLPEALETWSVHLLSRLLPRHLEIIYEINRRFLDEVRLRLPGQEEFAAKVALLDETGDEPRIRMANLAAAGCHAINGVATLHSELLKKTVLPHFALLYPEKFHSVTNGVSPRRFMLVSNPALSDLLTSRLGTDWSLRPESELPRLEPLAEDLSFRAEWRQVKLLNKMRLAVYVRDHTGVEIDPDSLLDVQVKRLHQYKRQYLNLLHIITLYHRLKRGELDHPPRTFLFGGKAAPSYFLAKLVIRLIHGVAEVVNRDTHTQDRLKVAFIPDFNVKVGQCIYPAADVSEHISLAGTEASGTGNMKFALNGAVTLGTLDGANIEIRQAVGEENFFAFGLTVEEVARRRADGYRPRELYEKDPQLKEAIDSIASGMFSRGDRDLFRPLLDALLNHDEFLAFADFASYVECQRRVSRAYADAEQWTRMSIRNVARSGRFSSDRAVREYAEKIWKASPAQLSPSQ